jgi:cytoskeletal protein RodZ
MPVNVADELPTRLKEEFTQVANTAKLYETNGNNMEVPSDTAREVSGLMDDIGLASKQQTSEVQSGMNSDMSPDTTPASMVPLNTDGINVPSQQESSLTPPEMSSAAVSQEMPSVEDTAAVKTPLPTATSASQAVPSTVAAPPVSNVVAPVASGKPPTPSGSPVVTAQSPVATPATSIKPVKEECKDHIVFLNIKLFYNISFSVNKDN